MEFFCIFFAVFLMLSGVFLIFSQFFRSFLQESSLPPIGLLMNYPLPRFTPTARTIPANRRADLPKSIESSACGATAPPAAPAFLCDAVGDSHAHTNSRKNSRAFSACRGTKPPLRSEPRRESEAGSEKKPETSALPGAAPPLYPGARGTESARSQCSYLAHQRRTRALSGDGDAGGKHAFGNYAPNRAVWGDASCWTLTSLSPQDPARTR